jgi:hypothetical protein
MAVNECLAAIHLCRIRATRLHPDGSPMSGPNNVYVSDKPIQLAVTPVYVAAKDSDLVGGCDCLVATYRGFDKLKRLDFALDLGALEWGLFEMMTGASAILSGGDLIGNWFNSNAFDCSVAAQPNVCFEGWQTGWSEDRQDATWPYVHWIWPSTYWALGADTLQNDFNQPKLTGFSRGNSEWGLGIFGDMPEECGQLGGNFLCKTIPAAVCGYQHYPVT